MGNPLLNRIVSTLQATSQPVPPVDPSVPTHRQLDSPAQSVYRLNVQGELPDGQVKVEINGQQMSFSLGENVKSGQTLTFTSLSDPNVKLSLPANHLIVADGRLQTAQQWRSAQQTMAPDLSSGARLLNSLGQRTSQNSEPVRVSTPTPLLNTVPDQAEIKQQLPQALQRAIQTSGLFYESHQADWLGGKISLASLRQEPQALLPLAGGAHSSISSQNAITRNEAQMAPQSVTMESSSNRHQAVTSRTQPPDDPWLYTRTLNPRLEGGSSPSIVSPASLGLESTLARFSVVAEKMSSVNETINRLRDTRPVDNGSTGNISSSNRIERSAETTAVRSRAELGSLMSSSVDTRTLSRESFPSMAVKSEMSVSPTILTQQRNISSGSSLEATLGRLAEIGQKISDVHRSLERLTSESASIPTLRRIDASSESSAANRPDFPKNELSAAVRNAASNMTVQEPIQGGARTSTNLSSDIQANPSRSDQHSFQAQSNVNIPQNSAVRAGEDRSAGMNNPLSGTENRHLSSSSRGDEGPARTSSEGQNKYIETTVERGKTIPMHSSVSQRPDSTLVGIKNPIEQRYVFEGVQKPLEGSHISALNTSRSAMPERTDIPIATVPADKVAGSEYRGLETRVSLEGMVKGERSVSEEGLQISDARSTLVGSLKGREVNQPVPGTPATASSDATQAKRADSPSANLSSTIIDTQTALKGSSGEMAQNNLRMIHYQSQLQDALMGKIAEELSGLATHRMTPEEAANAARVLASISRTSKGGIVGVEGALDDDTTLVEKEIRTRVQSESPSKGLVQRFRSDGVQFSREYGIKGGEKGNISQAASMESGQKVSLGRMGQSAIDAIGRVERYDGHLLEEAGLENSKKGLDEAHKSAEKPWEQGVLQQERKGRLESDKVLYAGKNKTLIGTNPKSEPLTSNDMRQRLTKFLETSSLIDTRNSHQPIVNSETIPMLRQQLQLLTDPRLVWSGELWPGQGMEMEIMPDDRNQPGAREDNQEIKAWRTTMKLRFPHLGEVIAVLHIDEEDVRIWLRTSDKTSADHLRRSFGELYERMKSVEVPLTSLQLDEEDGGINVT